MTRKITKIIIHHSVTPRNLELEKSLKSFNNSHKIRLYKKHNQPLSWTKFPYIAYHFVISEDWEIKNTRLLKNIWYHASNLKINNESIGICLCWNFDKEKPSNEQYKVLNNLIRKLKTELWELEVEPHNKYASYKTCPGKNFDMSLAVAGDYELLFKTWENVWKSEVLRDIDGWIKKTWIKKELAYSLLIMLWRIKK